MKNVDYQEIEKELQAFRRYIKRMKDLTRMYYPAIPNVQRWKQIESERFMTTVVDIFIMGAFLLGSVLVIYLKYDLR